MSPERQKQKTLEAVVRFLEALAADRPLLFIVEDLHWVDPTTTELLTRLLDQVPTVRLLALLTARPSFTASWPARSHLTSLTLYGWFTEGFDTADLRDAKTLLDELSAAPR